MTEAAAAQQPPDWLSGVAWPVTYEDGWWTVTGAHGSLQLGRVTPDARLYLTQVRGPLTIMAEKVHARARLRVGTQPGIDLNLGGTFAMVAVEGSGHGVVRSTRRCAIDSGPCHMTLQPDAGNDAVVSFQRNGENLEIRQAVGLGQVTTSGSLTLYPTQATPVDVDIGGDVGVGGHNPSATVVLRGRAARIHGNATLGAGTNVTCDMVSVGGGLDGCSITAKRSIECGSAAESTLNVLEPVPQQTAVRIGGASGHQHAIELELDAQFNPVSAPNTGQGPCNQTVIHVHGDGHVLLGPISGGRVATGGLVAASSIADAERLIAGRYVYSRDFVVGAETGRCEVGTGMLWARSLTRVCVNDDSAEIVCAYGDLDASDLICRRVVARQKVTNSRITATEEALLGQVTDSLVTLAGGRIESADNAVAWLQGGDLEVASEMTIRVSGDGAQTLTASAPLNVDVADGADVRVARTSDPQHRGQEALEVQLAIGADASVHFVDGRHHVCCTSAGKGAHLTFDGPESTVTFEPEPGRIPMVRLTAIGRTQLAGSIDLMMLDGEGPLLLADAAVIGDLSAKETRLGLSQGARIKRLEGDFRLAQNEGYVYGDNRDPPRLLGLDHRSPSSESIGQSGSLMQVDVVDLPFSDLVGLSALRVFDPAPRPLIEYARPGTITETLRIRKRPTTDTIAIRDKARWFDELAAQTESHALTGGARTAIEWGRHYVHHQRLGWRNPERWFRYLHRAVGYGYRPLPAMASLLLVTGAVALWALPRGCAAAVTKYANVAAVDQYCAHDGQGTSWLELPRAWVSVLVAPAKLVRLTDSTSPLPYFAPPLDSIVNVVVGLTFLFTVLAIRNYLRISPFS